MLKKVLGGKEFKKIKPYFSFGGKRTGIPFFMGYLALHLTQIKPIFSLLYLKSALHRGHAKISNKSFGIGSLTIFKLFFGIIPLAVKIKRFIY